MITAYAVGFIDTTQTPPVVTSVGIFSMHANGVTVAHERRHLAFDITRATGDSFGEASDTLIGILTGWHAWTIPLLERTP